MKEIKGYMKKICASILGLVLASFLTPIAPAQSSDIPHLEKKDGRYAFIVDGKPFLVLGGQINNSSAWPTTLPAAWSAAEAMHMNTVEAPVYWEQMEPTKGTFDFSNVDLLVAQAREHKFHLVLLWFGTWKNGQNHYVPEWIKSDTKTYPREENAYGKLLDVMSPNSMANLEADKTAFAALLGHVKTIDAAQHTVIMIQVENESGSVGSIRDFSPAAQKQFDAAVPAEFARAMHLPTGGTWSKTFGPDADESFAAYSTAHYIGEVAAAGKAVYPLPMYCNVWFAYPVHALENRDRPSAGQEYPSGGPQQANIPIWKAAAPAIDILAPDFYSDDFSLFRSIVATYERADNPLFIPESQLGPNFGRYFFYALGNGAIGFSPFGIDRSAQATQPADQVPNVDRPATPADNYALFNAPGGEIAQLNLEGKLQTAVEDKGAARQTIHFATADAVASFGFPQSDGTYPPGTPAQQGRAVVAQLGPLEFLVSGFDASVSFSLPAAVLQQTPNLQLEILRAEEGKYVDGLWQTTRILNGDQTDRGLNFRSSNPPLVRIHLHTLPLYDEAIHRKSE
jgi:beta-galactosidase GanA